MKKRGTNMEQQFAKQGVSGKLDTHYQKLTLEGIHSTDRSLTIAEKLTILGVFTGVDIHADSISMQGKVTVHSIVANDFSSEGETLAADLTVKKETVIKGQAIFNNVTLNSLHQEGEFKAERLVLADEGKFVGKISLKDLTGKTVSIKGSCNLDSLEAESLRLIVEGSEQSRIRNLQASSISIEHKRNALDVAIDTITAQTVEITRGHVREITAIDVRVGPGTVIENLNYSGSLQVSESARVGRVNRV